MVSHRLSRSVCRLAGGLVVLAFLAAVAVPAQAAPRNEATPTALAFIDWIHDILAYLDFAPAPEAAPKEPEGPRAILGKEGQCVDPNGVPIACPDSTTLEAPTFSDGVV